MTKRRRTTVSFNEDDQDLSPEKPSLDPLLNLASHSNSAVGNKKTITIYFKQGATLTQGAEQLYKKLHTLMINNLFFTRTYGNTLPIKSSISVLLEDFMNLKSHQLHLIFDIHDTRSSAETELVIFIKQFLSFNTPTDTQSNIRLGCTPYGNPNPNSDNEAQPEIPSYKIENISGPVDLLVLVNKTERILHFLNTHDANLDVMILPLIEEWERVLSESQDLPEVVFYVECCLTAIYGLLLKFRSNPADIQALSNSLTNAWNVYLYHHQTHSFDIMRLIDQTISFISKPISGRQLHQFANDAINVTTSCYGPRSPRVAELYLNLSLHYSSISDYSTSIQTANEALKIFSQSYPPQSKQIIFATVSAARSYADSNQLEKAKELCDSVAALVNQPSSNLDTSYTESIYNLACVKLMLSDFEGAFHLLKLSFNLCIQSQAPSKAMIGHIANKLGQLYMKLNAHDIAIGSLKTALRLITEFYGQTSPKLISVLNNLANYCISQNDYPGAQSYLLRVLSISSKFYAENHRTILTTKENLARVYRDMGRHDDAMQVIDECMRQMPHDQTEINTTPVNLKDMCITNWSLNPPAMPSTNTPQPTFSIVPDDDLLRRYTCII